MNEERWMTPLDAGLTLKSFETLLVPDSDVVVAINTAVSALEKQIPKKPGIGKHGLYFCPSCKAYEVFSDTGDGYVDVPLHYCNKCGQKIDWSETEWSEYMKEDENAE